MHLSPREDLQKNEGPDGVVWCAIQAKADARRVSQKAETEEVSGEDARRGSQSSVDRLFGSRSRNPPLGPYQKISSCTRDSDLDSNTLNCAFKTQFTQDPTHIQIHPSTQTSQTEMRPTTRRIIPSLSVLFTNAHTRTSPSPHLAPLNLQNLNKRVCTK